MDLTLQEKRKLINFFEFLLNEEVSKPLGKMNSEAVDNYVKILLNLQDKHVELSPEYIDEQVRKIFHSEETVAPETAKTTKKRYNKNKIWLVAACVSILVALFSILSFSSERSVVDVLEDFFGTFEFIPFGEEIDVGNESYGKDASGKVYNSIEAFLENENYNLLLPSDMVNEIDNITIINGINKNKEIHIVFKSTDLYLTIFLNSEMPEKVLDIYDDKITLNLIEYYLCILKDVNQTQAYFTYNNNLYVVTHSDEIILMEILNNMEEIKYED